MLHILTGDEFVTWGKYRAFSFWVPPGDRLESFEVLDGRLVPKKLRAKFVNGSTMVPLEKPIGGTTGIS
jgi:hypothetical protein